MKYLPTLLFLLFIPLSTQAQPCDAQAQVAQRKVIKPPTTARPQSAQQRRVVTPPTTARPPTAVKPQLPQGFGRPIQRPTGFGKQEWQKPQQQQVRPSHNYRHGSIIIGRPYVHPFNYPSVETRYHPIYGFYRVYHPPVIIQPQPAPVYPTPFSGLFFHFRF